MASRLKLAQTLGTVHYLEPSLLVVESRPFGCENAYSSELRLGQLGLLAARNSYALRDPHTCTHINSAINIQDAVKEALCDNICAFGHSSLSKL
ncbi:unnamed protein product [Rodentolepis nana]|uniref:Protein kinase domain-containing protein n=1 Tax=Rodentolepis nana TaxID=102285 RepID=A0A0R3TUL2_RODNA|nr:unnamed protein product [Rodentolepis nana]